MFLKVSNVFNALTLEQILENDKLFQKTVVLFLVETTKIENT